jgi:putative chitinase
VAGFLAQCRVESSDFTALEEGLYYTTPERIRAVFPSRVPSLADAATLCRNPQRLANRVYAQKIGNGDEASGDGWRYRGRGIKQLTGRANYAEASRALGRSYLTSPDLVAQPEDACLTAAWFWHAAKCNLLADSAQWDAITRAVNGPAMLQADRRRQYSEQALGAFA